LQLVHSDSLRLTIIRLRAGAAALQGIASAELV
jgi:hypothetical protein